jgi:carbon storage regulator
MIKEESEIMLVLSRKEGERIVIGDNITLVVSKVAGNRVTIGIEAPRDVKIARGELQPEVGFQLNVNLPMDASEAVEVTPSAKPIRGSLREFAAAVLPLQRQVG